MNGIIARVTLAVALALSWSGFADAQINDSEGSAASGVNDSLGTAQNLGAYAIGSEVTVNGWVDSSNELDVDFFRLTLGAGQTLFFDIDFAEDIGASADDDLGLDPEVYVFDAAGTLLAYNDDSDFFEIGPANQGTDPGSDPWADHDSFVGGLTLPAGTYYVAVAWYENSANATSQAFSTFSLSHSGLGVSGATPDSTFANSATCDDVSDPEDQCVGPYQLRIRDGFRAGSLVPALSPVGLLLLALGIAVAALFVRRTIG